MVNSSQLKQRYEQQGYFVLRDYFSAAEMASLREVILTFHEAWKKDNADFYEKEEAFNSSLITGSEYLAADERLTLFNFLSCPAVMDIVNSVIPTSPTFMNTQLFFNPVDGQQKDFWHRDCQYDFDLEDQKRIIQETQVTHLRIPIFDELGMELIPGTHQRWDNEEELNVREELNGKEAHDELAGTVKIPLAAGDVLVFSADMIHRGLYGMDRLALDMLVFDPSGDYVDYIDDDCLPDTAMLKEIKDPSIYLNSMRLKAQALADRCL